MKALAVITNIFLGIFIVVSSVVFVSNNTADLSYLNSTAKESNLYEGAAKAATKALISQAKEEASPEQKAAVKKLAAAIDKKYLTKKIEDVLKQFEEFSAGEVNKVELDLKDLVKKTQDKQAIALKGTDIEPIVLIKNEDGGVQIYQVVDSAKVGTVVVYVITGLLAAGSMALSIIRKRYIGLAITLLVSGSLILLSAAAGTIFNLAVAGNIKMPEDITVLNPYMQEFARMVVGDMARQYLLIAATLILLSAVLFVVDHKIKPKTQPASSSKNSRTPKSTVKK